MKNKCEGQIYKCTSSSYVVVDENGSMNCINIFCKVFFFFFAENIDTKTKGGKKQMIKSRLDIAQYRSHHTFDISFIFNSLIICMATNSQDELYIDVVSLI